MDETLSFIDWETSVQIASDGTEQPFLWEEYSNNSTLSGTYRFTGTLPQQLSDGNLLFETTGVDLTLSLNDSVFYQSCVNSMDENYQTAQAQVPLPAGTCGELSVTCTILDGEPTMFPPLIRFIPEGLNEKETSAIANRVAFPAGAAALTFVLTFGLFLLGIYLKEPDLSMTCDK